MITAVNGFAMGGGCEIALAYHLVVADTAAQFALSEVKTGLVAAAGGVVRLPRTVPPGRWPPRSRCELRQQIAAGSIIQLFNRARFRRT